MELQVDGNVLLKQAMREVKSPEGTTYLMVACLVGIMERIERLQGAILSLQSIPK